MRSARLLVLLLLILPLLAPAQKKKPKTLAALGTARYVYVEAMDGDQFTPDLLPADRQAISTVIGELQDWKRYVLTMNRNEADLLFIVRTGRHGSAKLGGGVSAPRPTVGTQRPNQSPSRADEVMVGGEVGPADDILQVYMMNPDESRGAILWNHSEKDGLSEPDVSLMQEFRKAVERDYPSTAANSTNANKP